MNNRILTITQHSKWTSKEILFILVVISLEAHSRLFSPGKSFCASTSKPYPFGQIFALQKKNPDKKKTQMNPQCMRVHMISKALATLLLT